MLPTSKFTRLNRASRRKLASAVRRFARKEDGSLMIFGVYVFVMMLMVVGWGIDLMRFERERAVLQYTLDRAVLAAADLDQTLPPADVVNDYFSKSGLSQYLTSVSVSQGLNFREVSATASAEVETQFMHMTGLDTLNAPALSSAEERIDGVEISMVLDVSGSMNSNNRLTNLRTAAKEFVDAMADSTEDDKLTISIVPYATQVSLTDEMFDILNTTGTNEHSNCINFDASAFESTSVNLANTYQRTLHFDPWYYFDGRRQSQPTAVGFDNGGNSLPVCEGIASRETMVLEDDPNTLKNYIDGLIGRGNTSIDIGMKWGTALLDPAFRPATSQLISAGAVDGTYASRPEDFDGDSLKVVVLMTDGQNTSQYYINDDYRDGHSDVWYDADNKKYSVRDQNSGYFYQYHNGGDWYGRWADHPFGQTGHGCRQDHYGNWKCQYYDYNTSEPPARLDYPELWAMTSIAWNAYYNYQPWAGSSYAWNQMYDWVQDTVDYGEKNARTLDVCDAAKDAGIIVYTIAFEAPSNGQAILKDCASSPAYYFDVNGLEISDAFKAIASSVRKLRLTQ